MKMYPLSRRLLSLLVILPLGTLLFAQDGEKKPRREEEDGPVKPRRAQPLRVEDDDPSPKKQRPDAGAVTVIDLAAEAERAPNRFVRDLFKSLAVPHDRLMFTSPPRTDLVEPLSKFIKPGRSTFVEARRFNERLELDGSKFSGSLTKDHGIIYYEQYAIERVNEFFKRELSKEPPGSRNYLSSSAIYREAERALTAVVRFHESARERGVRQGDDWDVLEKRLRRRLREVQLGQLHLFVEKQQWEAAGEAAALIVKGQPDEPAVLEEVAKLLARQVEQSLSEKHFEAARSQVERLQEQFPKSRALEPLLARLQKRAAELRSEAEKLLEQGNNQEASKRWEEARRIWPYASELRSDRFRPISDYSTLYVGVRSLPQFLSPGTACTEVEKQALDLLFESLIKYRPHAPGGPRYEPELAADMPRLTQLGREFQVNRQAQWSNGGRVTAPDVRATMRQLLNKNWPGHGSAWVDLFDRRNPVVANESFAVKLNLGQGYLDPLSLMTFKVLPQEKGPKQADDPDFASRPIGSGPFRYDGINADKHAVFAANPYYGLRTETRGRPRLGAVHFYQTTNPVADFTNGKLHLLLDPPTQQVQQLREQPVGSLGIQTLRNRRIWFLAVNHRRNGLDDARLRRALALAIHREQILNDCFRSGLSNVHRPLNGPYLPDTWAYNPKVGGGAADPFQPKLAPGLVQEALRERGGSQKLKLHYPAGDDAVRRACDRIKEQVHGLDAGLTIELVERPPVELRKDVERNFNYDLAYYSWDYPDHTYWLWPLFAPRDGHNRFGYRMDQELESAFRQLLTHREFARVQEQTHVIHQRFFEEMPFIPLWQLDTHLIVHPHLELPSELDAQAVFRDADQWRLKR